MGPHDVMLAVLYCGVCHSDIHIVRSDWSPATYPVAPGHEIVGRVIAVGNAVTRFKVGDIGGVGCMVDSCGSCENCLADREQNCLRGTTMDNGLTQAEASELLTHLAFYAGWPNAFSAVPIVKGVFDKRLR